MQNSLHHWALISAGEVGEAFPFLAEPSLGEFLLICNQVSKPFSQIYVGSSLQQFIHTSDCIQLVIGFTLRSMCSRILHCGENSIISEWTDSTEEISLQCQKSQIQSTLYTKYRKMPTIRTCSLQTKYANTFVAHTWRNGKL